MFLRSRNQREGPGWLLIQVFRIRQGPRTVRVVGSRFRKRHFLAPPPGEANANGLVFFVLINAQSGFEVREARG
jgi:hypothetical protein